MTILRSMDRNLSCRTLRDLLLQARPDPSAEAAPLPHTFERDALLAVARDTIEWPRIQTETRLTGGPVPPTGSYRSDRVRALDRMVPGQDRWDFRRLLGQRLGDGLPGRGAPGSEPLGRFLLLYAGDTFRSGHYSREFGLSQERAKRHLSWLCATRIIERHGTRKATGYVLAFHRTGDESFILAPKYA